MHTGRIGCHCTASGVSYYLNSNHIFGTNSASDFVRFRNYHRKFANLVAPPTDGTTKRLLRCKVHLKVQMAETASKSIHNLWRYPSSNCYKIDENLWFSIWRYAVAPSNGAEKNRNMDAQLHSLSSGLGAWQTEKNTYKHQIFAPTAKAWCRTSARLCIVVDDVEPILKGANNFSIQRSISYRMQNTDFWPSKTSGWRLSATAVKRRQPVFKSPHR